MKKIILNILIFLTWQNLNCQSLDSLSKSIPEILPKYLELVSASPKTSINDSLQKTISQKIFSEIIKANSKHEFKDLDSNELILDSTAKGNTKFYSFYIPNIQGHVLLLNLIFENYLITLNHDFAIIDILKIGECHPTLINSATHIGYGKEIRSKIRDNVITITHKDLTYTNENNRKENIKKTIKVKITKEGIFRKDGA